jgi:hypothetical protein
LYKIKIALEDQNCEIKCFIKVAHTKYTQKIKCDIKLDFLRAYFTILESDKK